MNILQIPYSIVSLSINQSINQMKPLDDPIQPHSESQTLFHSLLLHVVMILLSTFNFNQFRYITSRNHIQIFHFVKKIQWSDSTFSRRMTHWLNIEHRSLNHSYNQNNHSFTKETTLKFLVIRMISKMNSLSKIEKNTTRLIFKKEFIEIGRISRKNSKKRNKGRICLYP